jgi:hypothetical protein
VTGSATPSIRTYGSEGLAVDDVTEQGAGDDVVSDMRRLVGTLVVAALTLLHASPAAASCAPPASVTENAGRAVAVVYGTVTESGGGALTLRVDRALKGQVGATVRVFAGPGRGGVAGTAVATSIDYPSLGGPAQVGSNHVLYVVRGADGQFETNACIGSHSGPPDATELAFFGTGRAPDAAPPAPATNPDAVPPSAAFVPLWLALALALALAIFGVAVVLRRRRVA